MAWDLEKKSGTVLQKLPYSRLMCRSAPSGRAPRQEPRCLTEKAVFSTVVPHLALLLPFVQISPRSMEAEKAGRNLS